MELTHNELEQYHYREIRNNPAYALQCQQELYLEEMQMNAPIVDSAPPAQIDMEWTERQWDAVNQLRGEALYLKGKFLSLVELVIAKGYKPRYK